MLQQYLSRNSSTSNDIKRLYMLSIANNSGNHGSGGGTTGMTGLTMGSRNGAQRKYPINMGGNGL